MILHFPRDIVERLVAHCQAAAEHDAPQPGLWLVGGRGVYLRSSGIPVQREGPSGILAAYADEANPRYGRWEEGQYASFGCNDGAELVPLQVIAEGLARQPGPHFRLNVTPDFVELPDALQYAPG